MKKMQTLFFMLAVVSVFMLSFLIGRATALQKNKANNENEAPIYTGTAPLPVRESEKDTAAAAAAKVKKQKEKANENNADEQAPQAKPPVPPVRMEFPCGTMISKDYSESAVYSETMEDWRAHTGTDFAAPLGTDVLSSWDGTVVKIYRDKLWGYCIEIDHGGGVCSVYKNLAKKIAVSEGQAVITGQPIGSIGKSASLESHEAPHLHFEILQDGIRINPETYVYN